MGTLKVLAVVGVLGAGGWYGWENFLSPCGQLKQICTNPMGMDAIGCGFANVALFAGKSEGLCADMVKMLKESKEPAATKKAEPFDASKYNEYGERIDTPVAKPAKAKSGKKK